MLQNYPFKDLNVRVRYLEYLGFEIERVISFTDVDSWTKTAFIVLLNDWICGNSSLTLFFNPFIAFHPLYNQVPAWYYRLSSLELIDFKVDGESVNCSFRQGEPGV